MSVEATDVQRWYEVHGVVISINSSEPAVLEAMDLRLRDFRCEMVVPGVDVRFEFLTDDRDGCAQPAGNGRPVYETPYGSLYYYPDADALWGEFAGVSLRCEPGRGVAVMHAAAFTGRELYLATHPLATISLMELLERRARFSLHAACLATSSGYGVLLAGPSGSGKSTLALALARAGMSFLSDDVVFLEHELPGAVGALGFPDAVGVTEQTAERFAAFRPLLDEPPAPGFPKRLRRIEDLLGAPAVSECVPAALVFPQVLRDQPSRIASLDPQEALIRLVPDVLMTEPGATQAHLEAIAALLGQVQCYALGSGADLERAAELVRAAV